MEWVTDKRKWLATGIVLLGLGGLLLWRAPQLVAMLPVQMQQAIPGRVAGWLATPLPTALPAPQPAAGPVATIAPLLLSAATETPLPTATPTVAVSGVDEPTVAPTGAGEAAPSTPRPTRPATAVPTLPPPPAAVRLEGMDIIPQKFNNCGPANLSINLAYYGVDVPQLDIAASIRPTYDDRNVSPHELVDYVNNETNLRAAAFSGGDLVTLQRLIAAGFPVVVEKGLIPNQREGWMGHYLTLIGYDDGEGVFITFDTFLGPWDGSGLPETYDEVERFWRHFNYTFWVVYPPEQEPLLQAQLPPALLAANKMWQTAGARAQADISADPQDPFAWFNLGSSLIRLAQVTGEFRYVGEAVTAFDEARRLGLPWRMLWYQFTPYEAYLAAGRVEDVIVLAEATLSGIGGQFVEESHFYYGQALAAAGDRDRATAALQRALEVNPFYEEAAAALDRLGQ